MARARRWWPIAGIVTVLSAVNVVTNHLVSSGWYVPVAVAASTGLVAFAVLGDRRSWSELGLGRGDLDRGLRWGAVLVGLVLVTYVVAFAIPATRELFRDDRVEHWTMAQTLYAALVRVPFGTVLLEEVAFRGVLPAMLLVRTSKRVAVLASAGLFGLWHVFPSIHLGQRNPLAEDTIGAAPGWVPVLLAVVSTAVVGLVFWWLRDRSRSLLTPMALHWSTNALGYLFAHAAWTR